MGFTPYKVDPKYRISIPPEWRPGYGKPLILMFARRHELPVVKVFSEDLYKEKEARVLNSDKTPKEKGKYMERLAMLSRKASFNEQSKLLIPKDLSEHAGIEAEGEVVLAGRSSYFEIWAGKHFPEVLRIETSEEFDDDLDIF